MLFWIDIIVRISGRLRSSTKETTTEEVDKASSVVGSSHNELRLYKSSDIRLTTLFIDIVSSLPYDLIALAYGVTWIAPFRLPRLMRQVFSSLVHRALS
jgi:hypothetical protein